MNEIQIINGELSQELSKDIAELERLADEYKKKKEKMRKIILAAMKEKGIVKIDNDFITITYIEPTTQEKFDSKSLKADLPEIYNNYCNITPKADYVKVVRKGEKDGDMGD